MIVLDRRLSVPPETPASLRLPLSAQQRESLRGHRRTACGKDLLLQLPRGEALAPGEWLSSRDGDAAVVQVEAAPEPLLRAHSADSLQLMQAAYHLGNRHVALELRPGELRLLEDPVLEELLRHRGLVVDRLDAPFLPEPGAYAGKGGHAH
ncbi:urease accessory protein UreE [Synechococcus sp. ATX 2A4]|uniref:urease accessory protein UreE n=1 Tax=Synechococcus sp. ATX 2A4 TaxID=2823727 RepID=UPI0020CBB395|nr:urease accessory protein UreE [Synechococcus sp. ATX 2A4]MCP9885944.1 urease accessory protein UreE [Synechococcus sp. ATX 2A4]